MKITDGTFLGIVEKARKDPEKGFEDLYKATFNSSFGYARLYLKNDEDIKDALQQSYMYAFRFIRELKKPESFEFWLHTIIRNECLKIISSGSKQDSLFAVMTEKDPGKEITVNLPEQFDENREKNSLILRAVNDLPEPQRLCIVMFYFDEMKISEIANELGVPEGTIKSRLHKAKKTLKKELSSIDEEGILFSGMLPAALLAFKKNTMVSTPLQIGNDVFSSVSVKLSNPASSSAFAASTGAVGSVGTAASTAVSSAAGASAAVKTAAIAAAAVIAVGGGAAGVKIAKARKITILEVPASVSCTLTESRKASFAESSSETTALPEAAATVPSSVYLSAESTVTASGILSEKQSDGIISSVSSASVNETISASSSEKSPLTVKTTAAADAVNEKTETSLRYDTSVFTTRLQTSLRDPSADFSVDSGILKGYSGSGGTVEIPPSLNIASVGAGAFSGNTAIKSVSLPLGVEKIGQEAFSDCSALSSVSFPSSLKSIGIGAFYGCSSLESIAVPDGVTSIGDEAFSGCTLLKTVSIPAGVTKIGDDVFCGCDGVIIRCSEGSAAYEYAKENCIEYVLL